MTHLRAYFFQLPFLISGLILVVVYGLSWIFLQTPPQAERSLTEGQRVSSLGRYAASTLEEHVKASLGSAYNLQLLLVHNYGKVENFDAIAADLMRRYPAVGRLSLAPSGVVSQVYPLEGNATAIGNDLYKHPASPLELRSLIQNKDKEMIPIGPLEVAPDDWGFECLLPVFLPGEKGSEIFWGFVTVLIKPKILLDGMDLDVILGTDAVFRFSLFDQAQNRRVFFGETNPEPLPRPDILSFPLSRGSLDLEIAPKPHITPGVDTSRLSLKVSALFGILLSILAYILLRQREKLLTLSIYDRALGQPERYQLIRNTDRWLAENIRGKGKTAVMLLRVVTDSQQSASPIEQPGPEIQKLLVRSLRMSDLIVTLDTEYVLVVTTELPNEQFAGELAEKLFFTVCEYCTAQYPNKILAVKAGVFFCAKSDSSQTALEGVFGALRQAQEQLGDILVMNSSRRKDWKFYTAYK
jgi:sensor domain CHASE-containing protein